MEKVKEKQKVLDFLCVDEFPNGSGHGYGCGDGYCYGFDDGKGYGSGDGSGDGSCDGYDKGYGSGDGSGDGDDIGFGAGYGFGYGDGIGYGDGSGYGFGPGLGCGNDRNIEALNGQKVYKIDKVPTIIDSVHSNYAKGRILNSDLTTKPCYIAKCGNYFAHGETLKEAFDDAKRKYEENMPLDERIAKFNEQYPDRDKKIPAQELFYWHHVLTGSCLTGRKHFCEMHGLDYKNGEFTVNEFISITRNAYNGEVIRKLENVKP